MTQRRSEIGILRALGATRGQIRTMFLAESVIAGLFGSCLGLLLGIAIARAMTGYIGALLGEVYGIAQRAEEISTDPKLMLFAVVLGVITSVIAAFDSGAWRGARGSGAGVAERQIPAIERG